MLPPLVPGQGAASTAMHAHAGLGICPPPPILCKHFRCLQGGPPVERPCSRPAGPRATDGQRAAPGSRHRTAAGPRPCMSVCSSHPCAHRPAPAHTHTQASCAAPPLPSVSPNWCGSPLARAARFSHPPGAASSHHAYPVPSPWLRGALPTVSPRVDQGECACCVVPMAAAAPAQGYLACGGGAPTQSRVPFGALTLGLMYTALPAAGARRDFSGRECK